MQSAEPAGLRGFASPVRSGWLEAAGFVSAIGLLSLVYAIGHTWGAHPIAFVLYATSSAALAMLAITGPGADFGAIARHPKSWIVGISIIGIETFYFLVLAYVPPAHGNLVLRLSVPLAMAVGFVALGRRFEPLAVASSALIVGTVAGVIAITDAAVRVPMTLFGMLTAVMMVQRSFAAELHPHNRAARTAREKLRVTGILLLVTSALSLAATALGAAAVQAAVLPSSSLIPTLAQMLDGRTIALGTLAGGAVLALMNVLSFSSVVKIGTENLMAVMAFSPVTSWAFQELGVAAGWIQVARPEPRLVAAMAALVGAVLLIIRAGRRSAQPTPRA